MQRHVLSVARRFKCSFYEVVRRVGRHDVLELGEVLRVQLVVLDQLGGNLCMLGFRQESDELLFQFGNIADDQFGL